MFKIEIQLLGYSCPAHTMEFDQHIGSLYKPTLGQGQLEPVRTAFSRSLCLLLLLLSGTAVFLSWDLHGLGMLSYGEMEVSLTPF